MDYLKLKAFLNDRWAKSELPFSDNVYRTFRLIDSDHNEFLTRKEFINGIIKISGNLFTEKSCESMFKIFDTDNSGSISYKEFIRALHKEMNEARFKKVNDAFNKMDANRSGMITAADLNYSNHPNVLAGKTTAKKMADEYMSVFIGDYNEGDKKVITRVEFFNYYTDLSMTIVSDETFISMINTSYNL
jgi:Ca2+-binding EF-hand superfamily protein